MEEKTDQNNQSVRPRKKMPLVLILGLIIFVIFVLFTLMKLSYLAYYANESATKTATNTESTTKTIEATSSKTATKKSSLTKTTSNQQSSQQSSSDTSKKNMIEYFVDTAVYDYTKREFFVTRWNQSGVSVGVAEGEFTSSLNSCLEGFISDFNGQSSSAKLHRDDTVSLGQPNIKIYYWSDAAFKQRAGDIDYGYTEWIHKDDKSLQRSMLFLSEEIMNIDEAVRCQVIRHEMTHAVGFWGHSNVFFEGIMAQPKTRYIYPEEDKRLIRMLYNSGIPIGSTSQSTRDFLENNNW